VLYSLRNLQVEGGARAWFALSPCSPAHSFHCFSHYRQTNACARIVFCDTESLKNVKDLIVILHVEADAVVSHPNDAAPGLVFRADLDTRVVHLASELQRIVQIVSE